MDGMLFRSGEEVGQAPLQIADFLADAPAPRRGRPRAKPAPAIAPAVLARLATREREVAGAVYAGGEMAADEVRAALGAGLSNSAVRTMLNRLTEKNILKRRGAGNKFLYSAALPDDLVREAALKRLSDDYFGGSLFDAALALMKLVAERQPDAVRSISRRVRRTAAHA
jgi:predicted transcriptional regulator